MKVIVNGLWTKKHIVFGPRRCFGVI